MANTLITLPWLAKQVLMDMLAAMPGVKTTLEEGKLHGEDGWRQMHVASGPNWSQLDAVEDVRKRVTEPMGKTLAELMRVNGFKRFGTKAFEFAPPNGEATLVQSKQYGVALHGAFIDLEEGRVFRADILGHA